MYVRVREIAKTGPQDDLIVMVRKNSKIQEIRETIEKNLGFEQDVQKLYFKGKQLLNCYRILDYDINLNDVIQLIIAEPVENDGPSGSNVTSNTWSALLIANSSRNEECAAKDESIRCDICDDIPDVPCVECSCCMCHSKSVPSSIIICDECDKGFHLWCLSPPLSSVPDDEWFCPDCKTNSDEIVKDGEGPVFSKKKAKRPSNMSEKQNWGRGMACVGKSSTCTIVPPNHFGPIPGVEVGTVWKFRMQVAEAGVHRPPVAGIHGRESDGAYSIILSGGYEDDMDMGDQFVYTGSGGRDYSGNKRQAAQSSDQKLVRMNRALAMNCFAELNCHTGAQSTMWTKGKPVRVVRNYKLRKTSVYGPIDGNRYDGIYKVVGYHREKGASGFYVWKFTLRRDDVNPAPWEHNGRELEMIYPPGYLEAQKVKEESAKNKGKGKGKKIPNKSKAVLKLPEETKTTAETRNVNTPNPSENTESNVDDVPKTAIGLGDLSDNDVECTFNRSKPIRQYENKMKGKGPILPVASTSDSASDTASISVSASTSSSPSDYTLCSPVVIGNSCSFEMECASTSKGILKAGPSKCTNTSALMRRNVCFGNPPLSGGMMPHLELQEYHRLNHTAEKKTILEHYESVKEPMPSSSKHKLSESDSDVEQHIQPLKRVKVEPVAYVLTPKLIDLIEMDSRNKKQWDECAKFLSSGKNTYLQKVTEYFTCANCRELVCRPLTTRCGHNICCACMREAFIHKYFICPNCRSNLGKNYALMTNTALSTILELLFPGYDYHRE